MRRNSQRARQRSVALTAAALLLASIGKAACGYGSEPWTGKVPDAAALLTEARNAPRNSPRASSPVVAAPAVSGKVPGSVAASRSGTGGVALTPLRVPHDILDPSDTWTRPGVQELSGRIIARPWPRATLRAHGYTPAQADALIERAVRRLMPQRIATVASTGELLCEVPAGTLDDAFILTLRATGDYQFVTPDWLCFPASDDPMYPQQWQLPVLQMPQAWALTAGSPEVTIAIVDSGIDINHPDLVPNIRLPGHNSVGLPADAAAQGPCTEIGTQSHGTRCAGIAAAAFNNAVGIAGIAPRTHLLAVRCTNSPSGAALLSDMLNGAEWAARNGASVVNCSFSGVASPSVGLRGTVLKDFGALLFFAAGNSNSELSPAADWQDVIIVGALGRDDTRYAGGNYGVPIDLTAPGTDILSTLSQNRYGTSTGTSFACPQAAAVAALLWSAAPAVSPNDVQNALLGGTIDLGDIGKDADFGFGRLNALRALSAINVTLPVLLDAQLQESAVPGLRASYYELDDPQEIPDFSPLLPRVVTTSESINFQPGELALPAGDAGGIGVVFEGFFRATTAGTHTFTLDSVDGARLYVQGSLLVNNDLRHDRQAASASVGLRAGLHPIRLEYFCHNSNTTLILRVRTGSTQAVAVAASSFARVLRAVDVCDIADSAGDPGANGLVNEGDYNLFFSAFFSANQLFQLNADISDDRGTPGANGRVNEGDYNAFFNYFFLT
ncbi:hypothetical protein BH11PLA1_BH11PLA1_05720 [soil metagenome]